MLNLVVRKETARLTLQTLFSLSISYNWVPCDCFLMPKHVECSENNTFSIN